MKDERRDRALRVIVCAIGYSRTWIRMTNPIRAADQAELEQAIRDAGLLAIGAQLAPKE
jgi:hypothetical protein